MLTRPSHRPAQRASLLTEHRAIELLQREFTRHSGDVPSDRRVVVGIGDDAAVLDLGAARTGRRSGFQHVWSIDCSTEGVHFDLSWLTLAQAAARAFEAALSDVAAMGALPVAAVCNLQVPRGATAEQIRQVGRGQARRSLAQRCPIVGGNLSSGDRWQFTTSVLGAAKRPLLRGGALVGDELWLCGAVGEAGAGLSLLQRGSIEVTRSPTLHRAMRRCISAWRSPIARIAFGRELVGRAHAAIDVSDGLASEAEHLANSAQLRIVLHADALRGSSAAVRRVAAELELEPLHLLLNGGEDYALLAAGPTRARPKFARVVGRVEAGSGVVLEDATTQRALRGGFDHFTRTKR